MSKGGSSTVTQNVDPQTAAYVNSMRQYALGATGQPGTPTYGGDPAKVQRLQEIARRGGPLGGSAQRQLDALSQGGGGGMGAAPQLPPEILAAQQQYGQYANAGNLGLTALTGGANPFYDQAQQQALDPLFAQARQRALGDIGSQATLQNAYGGSRHGVAEGQALGTLGAQQAGLGYQAYNDSLQRALAAANLGFGAQAQSAFLPQQFYSGQLGLLQQAMGPYGTTQTQQMKSDPFSQLLGLATTAGGFFLGGPAGAAAGSQIMGNFNPSPGYG